MLSFSFQAKKSDGEFITDRITAKTAKEAWLLLEQQGLTSIELLDDENSAIKLNDDNSTRRLVFTAKEEQSLRAQKSASAKILWLFCRVKNVTIWLPLLIWLVYIVVSGGSRSEFLLPANLLIVYLVWFGWANIPSIMYNQALAASAWCRWREVEQWMCRLQRWKAWFKIPFPEHELLFRRATAEAGQGRINDGLRRVAHLETDSSLAPGFYYSRLASLFLASKDFQQAAQCQREALKLDPSDSSVISLAVTLARWLGDLSAAQALFDEIDDRKLAQMAKLFACYGRGVIALETKQPAQACHYLETVFSLGRSYAGSPLLQGLLLDARAYYALALVAIGESSTAEKHFKAARPMLIARGDTELLARCEKAQENHG